MNKIAQALTTVTLLFSLSALANTEIKSDMQVISESYSQLGTQINDSSKNASSIALVDAMIAKSKSAQSETPAKAAGDYKKQMSKMLDKLSLMKSSLAKNDNKGANKIYEELRPWTSPDHANKYQ